VDVVSRSLERGLRVALRQFRAVAVVGARQVGKSTLVRGLPGRHYLTLDDLGTLAAAAADPQGFVDRLPVPVTIDEVQRVPELLLAIKAAVDRERRPGDFLVTGSSRIDTVRGIRESLAGRVALLTLRPMTRLELLQRADVDPLGRIFECNDVKAALSRFAAARDGRDVSGDDVLAGGFPEPALHLDAPRRAAWFREYRKSYIERDVPAVLRVDDVPAFLRFLTACAATTARLLNVTDIARDVGVSVDTARRWIGVLEATYVAERRLPFWRNVRKRLVKSPKVFFGDSGLVANLLDVEAWEAAIHDGLAGPLLETWVHANLAAHAELSNPPVRLHFYRTHAQAEVDFVLARGRRLVGIEVKHGATVRPSDARGIEELASQFPRECPFGLVLYMGRAVVPLSEHAAAIPLGRFFG
jgi:predicted AAA+ superfamily ATPase